ncbi:MAG TPA: hypothetical protein VM492_18325 [Sumerlaeia bacterium]|nr:hypothetical protein [Sumerlaeia bacterium]
MRNTAGWLKRNGRRGSILTTTFFLCMLAALSSLWLIGTLMDHQRTNQRRRDVTRAYFAAEGGIAQIIEWGNNTPGHTLDGGGTTGMFYRDPVTNNFPNLLSAIGSEYQVPADKLGAFQSDYGYDVATVESVTLEPPDGSDPVSCSFKATAVGATSSGSKRRVLAYLNPNPIITTNIQLPAALISMGTAGMAGNAKIHWGEAWSKLSFDLPGKNDLSYLDNSKASFDQWARYRSEARIVFPADWGVLIGLGKKLYDVANPARMYPGRIGSPVVANGDFAGFDLADDADDPIQHYLPAGTLVWPDWASEYQNFKDLAKLHGRYYSTDGAGNVYIDGVEDAAHLVGFSTEFTDVNRDAMPYDFAFIDTIDGNPPAVDGSNLANISDPGSAALKGVFYICANFAQTGTGSPPGLTAETPEVTGVDGDGNDIHATKDLTKIYLDGVLYAAGTLSLGGNAGVYGCAVAERGYVGGGTPDVYYNHRLRDGLVIEHGNIGSVFRVVLQRNY